jgi:hypothetical protein
MKIREPSREPLREAKIPKLASFNPITIDLNANTKASAKRTMVKIKERRLSPDLSSMQRCSKLGNSRNCGLSI